MGYTHTIKCDELDLHFLNQMQAENYKPASLPKSFIPDQASNLERSALSSP